MRRRRDPTDILCNDCYKARNRQYSSDKHRNKSVQCSNCVKMVSIKKVSEALAKQTCRKCVAIEKFRNSTKVLPSLAMVTTKDEQPQLSFGGKSDLSASDPQHLNLKLGAKRTFDSIYCFNAHVTSDSNADNEVLSAATPSVANISWSESSSAPHTYLDPSIMRASKR